MIVDLSKLDFLHRLNSGRRNQWFMYHVGFLYEDRPKSKRLNALAHTVYAEYKAGHCTLVQRRLGPGKYEYYAVKL